MASQSSRAPVLAGLLLVAALVFVVLPLYFHFLSGKAPAVSKRMRELDSPPTAADIPDLKRRAEKGEARAQYRLGLACHKGIGVDRDPVEAYKWFTLASKRGLKAAAIELDQLLPVLSPEQIADGRRRMDAFTPTKPASAPTIPSN